MSAPTGGLLETVQEEGTFRSRGLGLFRRCVRPEARPWAYLGVIHGYGDHSGRFVHFMTWLAERGIACHAFDFQGQGRSKGRRGYVPRWSAYQDDLEAFLGLDLLSPRARGGAPLFLLGHSHGALVVASSGSRLRDASGCILTAPYFRSRMYVPPAKVRLARAANSVIPWLRVSSGLSDDWMSADPEMLAESLQDRWIVRVATPRWYIEAHAAQDLLTERAGEFKLPLLAMIGEEDPISDPGAVREWVAGIPAEDKTFRTYPGLLHELLREKGREVLFQEIRDWIEARVPAP